MLLPGNHSILYRLNHEEELVSTMTRFYLCTSESRPQHWTADDIVRFESQAYAVQNLLDIMLRMVSKFAVDRGQSAQWLDCKVSAHSWLIQGAGFEFQVMETVWSCLRRNG